MRRLRNVKIVATLGPASSDYAMIRALFDAGADVFRLNMSHGSHAEQAARESRLVADDDDAKAGAMRPRHRLERARQGAPVAGGANVVARILVDDAVAIEQQGAHALRARAAARCPPRG